VRVAVALLLALPLAGTHAAAATVAERNSRVLFVSNRGEALAYPSVYSVSIDGGRAVVVARRARSPVVSPNGRRLAFLRGADIALADLAHPGRARVLARARGRWRDVYDLSWSPAGNAVAFTGVADNVRTLWIMRVGARRPLRVAVVDPVGVDVSGITWSPDGERIAFARAVPVGHRFRISLAVANVSTGRVRAIPSTGGGGEPAWSPDGRRIAFVVWNRDRYTLTLVRPDGSGRRSIAREACNPEWSPGGTRLAVSLCDGPGSGVGVLQLRGGGVRWLVRDAYGATWDHRGAWILARQRTDLVAFDPRVVGRRRLLKRGTRVFSLLENERPSPVLGTGRVLFTAVDHPRGRTGLYTVAPDGGGARPFGASFDHQPSWSPDGRRLAVVRDEHVVILDRRGTLQRILARGGSPAWSPDGSRIAFAHDPDGDEWHDPTLFVIPSRGGESRELGLGGDPSWSPDGDRVVVGRDDGELWIYPTEGGVPTQVTHVGDASVSCPSQSASDPAWSPDGRTIVYVHTWANCFARGVERLAILDLSTGVTRPLVRGRESEFELAPTWSPDGRFVAYEEHIGDGLTAIARVRSDGTGHRFLYKGPGEAFSPTWAPA
jgi:Tol biopolymer transport system component